MESEIEDGNWYVPIQSNLDDYELQEENDSEDEELEIHDHEGIQEEDTEDERETVVVKDCTAKEEQGLQTRL